MSFASPLFLWLFLPLVLGAILAAPRHWRNGIIAVASLIFYAVGAGATTLLLLVTIAVNYLIGQWLEPDEWALAVRRKRVLLITVICFNVGSLVVWKYLGFMTEQLNGLAELFGGDFPITHLLLPIGISF